MVGACASVVLNLGDSGFGASCVARKKLARLFPSLAELQLGNARNEFKSIDLIPAG